MKFAGTATPGANQRNVAREEALLAACRVCFERGQHLPSYRWFAAKYHVTEKAITQVFMRLEAEGRVKIRRKMGAPRWVEGVM